MNAEDVIRLLELSPLPGEGGFFRQTHLSQEEIRRADGSRRRALSSIYYLVTPESFSSLHKLPSDEVFHFYLGDTVEMIQLSPEGNVRELRLGSTLLSGELLQTVVPAHTWQGTRLVKGGRWALLGTNVGPGFEFEDLLVATEADLLPYPRTGTHARLWDYLRHSP